MKIERTAPKGYASKFQFYYEFTTFGPYIWEGADFLVLLFHVERSIRFGKEGNAHSRDEAMNGVFWEDPKTGEISILRGPAGVGDGSWTRSNRALLIDDDNPQILEFVDVMYKDGPLKGTYKHSKPTETPRVLRNTPTLKAKRGGSGKTLYLVDTLRIKAVMDQWKELALARYKNKRTTLCLIDGTGATDSEPPWLTVPVENDLTVSHHGSVTEPPRLTAVSHHGSLSEKFPYAMPSPARAPDLVILKSGLEVSEYAAPVEIRPVIEEPSPPDGTHSLFQDQEQRHQSTPASDPSRGSSRLEPASKTFFEMGRALESDSDLIQIVKAMEDAMGRSIKNNHPAPGQFLALLRKFDWPVELGCMWIHDLAKKKRAVPYEITSPGLFTKAAGDEPGEEGNGLVPWMKANPDPVNRAFRERDLLRYRQECEAEIRRGASISEMPVAVEPPKPSTCPTCGQEAVLDGNCTSHECLDRRSQERASERRTAGA